MRRKKLCLVVIGKIDYKDLEQKVKALAVLPEGKEDIFSTETPLINKSTINYKDRELATNYIMGAYGSAPAGTREKTAMNLGTEILNDRLFVEIRTKRNLSYAPAAIQVPLFDPYNLLYVSTVKPNEAVQVMIDELKKMKKEGVTEKELRNKKEAFLTNLYMAQESNDAQAEIIGSLDYTRGWQYYDVLKDDIYSITKAEVDNVYKKYVNGIYWQYLGTRSLVNEKIFLQPLQ
jgi:predicted Zn-dependent peptidase